MEIIFFITGILIGAIITWLLFRTKLQGLKGSSPDEIEKLKVQISSVSIEKGRVDERIKITDENLKQTTADLSSEREKNTALNSELSSLKSNYNNLQTKLSEQKVEVEKLQEKFTKEFENLANKILDEKSSKFTLQNKENLDQILKPLNDKIKDFEKRVEET